jgi:streptomycin 6-kinase
MSYEFTEKQKNDIIENWGQDSYSKILRDIEIYSKKWKLWDFQFLEHYSINAIFFCKSNRHGNCVLKLGLNSQDAEFAGEYNILREYSGKKYVRVFEHNINLEKREKAMLIERCIPGKMLSEEESFEKRAAVFAELFSGLHVKPKNPRIYESYESWVCNTADYAAENIYLRKLNPYMQKAKALCLEIIKTYNRKMLLHIDIFADNIVSSNGGYKIIDPKGFTGDPIFDTGQFIFNECCENGIEPQKIESAFAILEKSLNIPDKILRQCFYIETIRFICHELSDGEPDDWDIEVAKFAYAVLNKK